MENTNGTKEFDEYFEEYEIAKKCQPTATPEAAYQIYGI